MNTERQVDEPQGKEVEALHLWSEIKKTAKAKVDALNAERSNPELVWDSRGPNEFRVKLSPRGPAVQGDFDPRKLLVHSILTNRVRKYVFTMKDGRLLIKGVLDNKGRTAEDIADELLKDIAGTSRRA